MREKRSVIAFLLITFGLSSIFYVIWIRGGEAAAASGVSLLLMWSPAAAAFIVQARYYRKEKILGLNSSKPSFLLAGIIAPILYLGLSYGVFWLANPGSFTFSLPGTGRSNSSLLGNILPYIILVFLSIFAAAGEEIGWRGFLLPQMTKIWNIKTAVIVTGVIWAGWHMPLIFAGLYQPGTPLWYKLPVFIIGGVGLTVIMAVLRFESGSVWPAILLHASHNYFDQSIFGPMTHSPTQAYFVGETGIITLLATIFVAVGTVLVFWKRAAHANQAPGMAAGPSSSSR